MLPTEPTELRAGDTWNWTRAWGPYPSALYTLQYIFNSPFNRFVLPSAAITADEDGQSFDIQATSAQTLPCAADTYQLLAVLSGIAGSSSAGQQVTLPLQNVLVQPDLLSASGPVDTRSSVKKQLDALEAALAGDTRPDVLDYMIEGRQIHKIPPAERIRLLSWLRSMYRAEQRAKGEYTQPSTISFRLRRSF